MTWYDACGFREAGQRLRLKKQAQKAADRQERQRQKIQERIRRVEAQQQQAVRQLAALQQDMVVVGAEPWAACTSTNSHIMCTTPAAPMCFCPIHSSSNVSVNWPLVT